MSLTLINSILAHGVAADLPSGDAGSSLVLFYATDTDVLYVWNGTSWASTGGTEEWTAGAVANVSTGLTITSGTLTAQWQAGSVTSIGTGLTLAAGALAIQQAATISSSIGIGGGAALTSGTAVDVTHIVLTAGNWLVYGNVGAESFGSSTSVFGMDGWIGTASATEPSGPNGGAHFVSVLPVTVLATGSILQPVGAIHMHITTTTTVYLGMVAFFTGGGGFGSGGCIVAVPVNTTTP